MLHLWSGLMIVQLILTTVSRNTFIAQRLLYIVHAFDYLRFAMNDIIDTWFIPLRVLQKSVVTRRNLKNFFFRIIGSRFAGKPVTTSSWRRAATDLGDITENKFVWAPKNARSTQFTCAIHRFVCTYMEIFFFFSRYRMLASREDRPYASHMILRNCFLRIYY